MKFHEGSSVEVLRRVHEPRGSWFPGNVISVRDDYFIVKYDSLGEFKGEPVVEKVHKEDVRPQPPIKKGRRWMVGDVAEVFDVQCWRFGKIVKVLKSKSNNFVVRLFGSIQLKEFHESKLRIQQAWHKNKWTVIEKVAQNKESTKKLTQNKSKLCDRLFDSSPSEVKRKGSCLRKTDKQRQLKDVRNNVEKHLPAKMVNRSNYYCVERSSKNQLSCMRGCHKPLTRNLPLFRQVDNNISYQKVRANEHSKEGSNGMDDLMVKAAAAADWVCNSSEPPHSGEDSDQCSVASCSSNNFFGFPTHNYCNKALDDESDNSDAESSFPSSSVNILSTPYFEHKLEANIHELEFHAYKSTVRALYASGPLSWEQESLLTNLRLSLHISDEEHLLQLRHLLSTQVL